MRKLFALLLALVLVGSLAMAQSYQWNFVTAFPDTNLKGASGCHGIAVSPDGRIWIQLYGPTDSIFQASTSTYRTCRKILVYNPDGTPAPISGFKTITVNSVTDTLYSANVGLRADHEGNILICSGQNLYRVNYTTGEGMAKVIPVAGLGLTAPGVTAAGEILTTTVLPGNAAKIYDAGFNYLGNVTDTVYAYGRSVNISADGNDVFLTRYSQTFLLKYHSDNGTLGPYVLSPDTLLQGMAIESSGWNPKTNLLYVSSGGQIASLPPYSNYVWYGWNPTTNTIVDTLRWNMELNGADPRPRAIAFSPGGDTAYVGQFNDSRTAVQMFVRTLTSVEVVDNVVPENYTLSQNYPNPFNPSTTIEFSIPKAGFTTVKVFDMLGREVATLVNEQMNPGTFRTQFDASRVSSGTYIYSLTSGGFHMSKKMVLVK